MGNEILQSHQRTITRNYLRRLGNLVKLGRFSEASQTAIRFNGILQLWEIQKISMENATSKDGSAAQRETLKRLTIKI